METTRETQQHLMEARMKEWGARLDLLKSRAQTASAELKVELHRQSEELGKLHESGRRHLDEFKSSSKETWDDVKKDVEANWASLSASIESLWGKVKGK